MSETGLPPSYRLFCKKDKESVQFSIKHTPKANFFYCQVRQLQNQMLYSGNNRTNPTGCYLGLAEIITQSHKKYRGWGGCYPKSQEEVGSKAERRLDLPQDNKSVICSMDSVLALGP